MTDKNGNTTTWQDNHSGLRRHKLMTRELADTIPAPRTPMTNVRTTPTPSSPG